MESVWKMWRKRQGTHLVVFHLFYSQLSHLELAVDALINVISAHVPSTTKFSDLWGDTPHGMPIVRREEANDSATRLLNLKERCKSVIECWEVQGAMAQGGKGHLSASDVNVLHIAELFKQWKEKDIPEMPEKHSFEYGYPEPAEPCEQHACS